MGSLPSSKGRVRLRRGRGRAGARVREPLPGQGSLEPGMGKEIAEAVQGATIEMTRRRIVLIAGHSAYSGEGTGRLVVRDARRPGWAALLLRK